MRKTSGIIINDDIFINSNHVIKMEKGKKEEGVYGIDIYLSEGASPVNLTFDNENDCNVIFNKIIMEMYAFNYENINF